MKKENPKNFHSFLVFCFWVLPLRDKKNRLYTIVNVMFVLFKIFLTISSAPLSFLWGDMKMPTSLVPVLKTALFIYHTPLEWCHLIFEIDLVLIHLYSHYCILIVCLSCYSISWKLVVHWKRCFIYKKRLFNIFNKPLHIKDSFLTF